MTTTLCAPICFLAALVLTGCQTPGSAAPSPSPPPVRTFTTCFTAAPAAWNGTQRASLPTTRFSALAVTPAGDRAYGFYRDTSGEQGIAAVDLTSGALDRVIVFPAGSSAPAALAVDLPWLAWVQVASAANPTAWTLEARDLDTGEQFIVATSRLPDGGETEGMPTSLVVNGKRLVWAQPTTKAGQVLPGGPRVGVQPTDEVRVYDLALRRQAVLGPGVGPFIVGQYLVWSRAGGVLQAADWSTLTPAVLPADVRRLRGGVLAASSNVLVWSFDDQRLMAWHPDRGKIATYVVGDHDYRHYMAIAGRFLIWFTSQRLVVLDLDSGGGHEVPQPGSIAGSETAIVRTAPMGPIDSKLGASGTVVSVIPTASAPAIPGCGAR
jgi:hypothetical protein